MSDIQNPSCILYIINQGEPGKEQHLRPLQFLSVQSLNSVLTFNLQPKYPQCGSKQ